jgi:hypothetical protein
MSYLCFDDMVCLSPETSHIELFKYLVMTL